MNIEMGVDVVGGKPHFSSFDLNNVLGWSNLGNWKVGILYYAVTVT